MKLLFHAGVIVVSALLFAVSAAEPNYVKTTVVGIGTDNAGTSNSADVVSITYTDGLGRTLQAKANSTMIKTTDTDIPAGTKFLTTGVFYDDAGRPEITTKPFITTQIGYESGDFSSINATYLQSQYSQFVPSGSSEPYAYSQTKYYDDPLLQVSRSGAPGSQNCLGSDGETAQWNFGVGLETKSISLSADNVQWSITLKDGFFITTPTRISLDLLYTRLLTDATIFPDGTNYILSITRDAGGKYAQVLKDLFGRTIATAVHKNSNSTELIVSKLDYDILGNLLTETPPTDNGSTVIGPTKYQYNTLGQVIRKETPDGLIERYEYDDAGLLYRKFFYIMVDNIETQYQNGLVYDYDSFGRLLSVTPVAMNALPYVEYFYDNVTTLASRTDIINLPEDILGDLKNLRGRTVAAVSYNTLNRKYQVIDLYSYDDDGNVAVKYKVVPGTPLQKTEYTYDIHGRKLAEKIIAGTVNFEKQYSYDVLGRLKEIVPAHDPTKKLAVYNYNQLGQLESKNLNGTVTSAYQYTINSQARQISNTVNSLNRFEETLVFKPDGNINNVSMTYDGYGTSAKTINQGYTYDLLNRLTGVTSANDALYNCSYAYDDAGRLTTKTEGSSNLTGYAYYSNTSRLKKAKTSSAATEDYYYDKLGNLVVDKTKNMIIEYDWRNLPVRFNFYNVIPDDIGHDNKGDYTIMIDNVEYPYQVSKYMDEKVKSSNSEVKLLSSVTMLYDAAGNRVLKIDSDQ